MDLYRAKPMEAVRVTQENVPEAAEWMSAERHAGGYFQYGAGDAKFRTPTGDLTVPFGNWVVRLGREFVVLSETDFEAVFDPSQPAPPETERQAE